MRKLIISVVIGTLILGSLGISFRIGYRTAMLKDARFGLITTYANIRDSSKPDVITAHNASLLSDYYRILKSADSVDKVILNFRRNSKFTKKTSEDMHFYIKASGASMPWKSEAELLKTLIEVGM